MRFEKNIILCFVFLFLSKNEANCQKLTMLFDDIPVEEDVIAVLGKSEVLSNLEKVTKKENISIHCLGYNQKIGSYSYKDGLVLIDTTNYSRTRCNFNLEQELLGYIAKNKISKFDFYSNEAELVNRVSNNRSSEIENLSKSYLKNNAKIIIFHSLGRAHPTLNIDKITSNLTEGLVGEIVEVKSITSGNVDLKALNYTWCLNGTEIRGERKADIRVTIENFGENEIKLVCKGNNTDCVVEKSVAIKGLDCDQSNFYELETSFRQFLNYDDKDQLYWIELLDLVSEYNALDLKYSTGTCYVIPIKLSCPYKRFRVELIDENGEELKGFLKYSKNSKLNLVDMHYEKSGKYLFDIDDEIFFNVFGEKLDKEITLIFLQIPYEKRRIKYYLRILAEEVGSTDFQYLKVPVSFKQCE